MPCGGTYEVMFLYNMIFANLRFDKYLHRQYIIEIAGLVIKIKSNGFWNCPDSVVFFAFHFYSKHYSEIR